MPRRARARKSGEKTLLIGIILIIMLMLGFAAALQPSFKITVPSAPSGAPVTLTPSEDIELERKYGPLAPVVKSLKSIGDALLGARESGVGLEAELGYTSTTGQTISFLQSFSGVGMIGMSGVFVKPSLGDYRALKLYDAEKESEGEVWVKPSVRIKAYEGVVEEWAVTVNIKIAADGEVIDSKTLSKNGKGAPPAKIELDKAAARGKALYALLLGNKETARKLMKGEPAQLPKAQPQAPGSREICFYADYQGMVKFAEEDEPSVKEVKNMKLGCFNFEFKQTGAFEMIVDRNVTVAPLAEVFLTGESGMQGYTPVLETVTAVVTKEGTIYTVTNVVTKWQTKTVTTTVTQISEKTVTVTVTKAGSIVGPLAGVLFMKWPYSEFIFVRC
ncbi:MAG: hypothetical protein QW692_02225 [Nitrososphaerota archaeon]